MTTIHVLQHVPFEGTASIGSAFLADGVDFSYTRLYAGEALPALNDYDLILVMGGPMSVHDEVQYPWLKDEKAWLRQAIAAGRRIVGICLGAQLLAELLGAQVMKNARAEIGWFPVQRVGDDSPWSQLLPSTFTAFHWHGETFTLPEGAHWLLSSEACAHQAFIWRKQVLGLQCHLEMTTDSIAALCQHCADDITAGGAWVQTADAMVGVPREQYVVAQSLMAGLMAYMLPTHGC